MTFSCSGECGEQKTHAEGVIDVTEGIDEGGVPGKRQKRSRHIKCLLTVSTPIKIQVSKDVRKTFGPREVISEPFPYRIGYCATSFHPKSQKQPPA